MSSQHFRSASATERKTAAGTARVNTNRAREYERHSMHETGSPISVDGMENGNSYDDASRKHEKKMNGTDRRREKTTITTTETFLTKRSPLKEGANVTNRSPLERRPRSRGSPMQTKKPKEVEKGMGRAATS